MTTNLPARFWSKVDRAGECWLWTAAKDRSGYGVFGVSKGRTRRAHLLAFEDHIGHIPDGRQIDHRCRNKSCVNPAHLQAVTPSENAQNVEAHRDSKSGVRGVHWDAIRQRWTGQVCIEGRKVSIGRYRELDDAAAAIRALRMELHTNNLTDRSAS